MVHSQIRKLLPTPERMTTFDDSLRQHFYNESIEAARITWAFSEVMAGPTRLLIKIDNSRLKVSLALSLLTSKCTPIVVQCLPKFPSNREANKP